MSNRLFIRRLRRDLPVWQEQGWLAPGGQQAILEHAQAAQRDRHFLAFALTILGVVLLGSGVITWFAANWDVMPKIVKLGVLFGALWTALGVSSYLSSGDRAPRTGQAVLLLGLILYGASIMLVAQIYHIDSHYPNGVLLWSLGALLGAVLLRSQAAISLAIVLAVIWTAMESLGFGRQVHWEFLVLWAAFLPLIHRHGWRGALHLALAGLLLWSWFVFLNVGGFWRLSDKLYLVQVFALSYLALFLAGMVMATRARLAAEAGVVQRYAAVAVLLAFYALTFPRLQTGSFGLFGGRIVREPASALWVTLTLVALALVVVLALWHRFAAGDRQRPAHLVWGQLLIAAAVVLVLANLFLGVKHGGMMALGFNLIFFAGAVWLVAAGLHSDEPFFINVAFVFFALALMSRYFDTFWSLLNRSWFFMGGGVLLIGGGYALERQRRRLTARLKGERPGVGS